MGIEGTKDLLDFLEDDEANYEACKLMRDLYGMKRCIVQLNDPPMNLFSVRTVNAFERLLPTLADDFGVRCVVIRVDALLARGAGLALPCTASSHRASGSMM